MPRKPRSSSLDSRDARSKLKQRPKPYSVKVESGLFLDYYRGKSAGTWYARRYKGEGEYERHKLGIADDAITANGVDVLTADDARKLVNAWSDECKMNRGVRVGPYTVADAAADWLKTQTGSASSVQTSEGHIRNYILPTLGNVPVKELHSGLVESWLHRVAAMPPVRVSQRQQSTKKLSPSRQSKIVYNPNDPETKRKRQDTANRVFATLSALLTKAYKRQYVASKAAWETVQRFENVDSVKNEYLTLEEAERFIAVCPNDFRELVKAALITGCRYGELCALKVSAYDRQLRAISLVQAKTGKPKHVFLTDDEAALFEAHIEGKPRDAFMFLRDDGKEWGKSHQQDRMADTLKAAGIDRNIRFHDLRHTFATLLAMNGTSMQLIANQLGHSGTRVAEKHYAHFSPSYVASTIRANKPAFGFAIPKPGPVLVSRAS